ncbi:unnamed protein product [Parascedosporium putredinis]|uniref:Enoyl reductase (ER) domain-containing protein n=1 Tax=Parascedosporium putredinis TaxID=1442378 RepID=A0A9P1H2Q3_9PEZI|nr:unnamed protein product [Parascedosporium putredinis]CAI7993937.1 unnamed protein product [Parascedosporium putredinis]
MAQNIPQTVRQWNINGQGSFDNLQFSEQPVQAPGDHEVLVKIQGASLNNPPPLTIIPQYRTVLSVGKHVTRFKPGDKVITLFNQGHLGGSLDNLSVQTGLGGVLDGTLRTVGAFNENGLVPMPSNLNFIEAASLTCAGLTAWNALFGGTGGVSIFAVQFAKAAGARVIATTSSDEKAELLRTLGADHIINYRETPPGAPRPRSSPEAWAVRMDGPGFLDALTHICHVRGVLVGNRVQMEEMCRAVEANPEKLRPVIDPKVFTLDQLKEAYEYQWSGKHQGKVGIKIE